MRYDVFLSHNRFQKPWVRHLYRLLCKEGLKVFLDEEHILPGANIVSAIEQGLQSSQHVVLVLSPTSLRSRWVAMETQLTVHADPDATARALVPIVIEPVDFEALRPSLKSLNMIDLTNPETREARLRFLLHHLGVGNAYNLSHDDLHDLLSPPLARVEVELHVGGIQETIDWGWDGIKLLDEFIRLDYATIDDLRPTHEGNSAQWAPIFTNHPDTWRMLFSAPGKIVGYWHFAPLFPADYLRASRGELLDSEITADKIRLFELPGHYDVYFVQICLHPEYRSPRNVRLLFDTIFGVLDGLCTEGVFVENLCANAYTANGHALCKSFNLGYVCDHAEHGTIYAGNIKTVLGALALKHWPRLFTSYREEGLI